MGQGYRVLIRLTDWVSYIILASMAIVVCVDILCRYFLGFSTQIAEEAASLGLVALIFLSLPGAFEDDAFLRVDVLYRWIDGRLKQGLDVIFHVAAILATLVYIVSLGRLVVSSFTKGIHADTWLGTPTFLPQAVMTFGIGVLLVALVAGLLRVIGRMRSAQPR